MAEKRFKTLGYQVMVEMDEIPNELVNDSGIIIASGTESHKLRSGIVMDIGSLALKEDPEIEIGDRIHFLERDLQPYVIDGIRISIVNTSGIKVIEKLEK